MNTDGTHEQRLISRLNGAHDHTPSPDARLLAYGKQRWIYLMRPDGTHKRKIIGPGVPEDREATFDWPTWSPNGRSLVFGALCETTFTYGIYRAEIRTGRARALIPCGKRGMFEFPDWSRTNWIAYSRYTDSKYGIWAMRPDGSQNHLILNTSDRAMISWSPDGGRLAFGGRDGIWVVDSDGKNARRLITGCHNPQWATSGDVILCGGTLNGQTGAFTIRPDGTGLRLVHRQRPATGEGPYLWMRSPT